MRISLSILFSLLFTLPVFSQDLQIEGNPYENADEEVSERKAFNRERWFNEQRIFPFNHYPKDAYEKAVEQRDLIRDTQGYFANSRMNWVSIGPTSGAYFGWGNISSRITTVQVDPSNPNIIYIGAAYGGVWKSTDAGTTWTSKTDDEVSMSSGSIAIDPNNTNIIYYGTGEATYSGASYYGRGLLKSTDGGDTWTSYNSTLPNLSYTSRIVIRPNHSDELLAAMGTSGLYRSTDAGENWTQLLSGRCDDVVFSPTGDTAYIVGSGTSYRRSTDGGVTWTAITGGIIGTRNHITICKSSPNVLYSAKYGGGTITVYKSTDAGLTFSPVGGGTNFNGGQAWYDFYMYVNPSDPDYAYVGSIDMWRTTNGGSTFQNITNGYNGGNVHVDQQNMTFHPTDPDKMYCTNDGGIYYSTNRGTTWSNLNAGLTLTQFYRIAADPSNASHVMGGTQDNGTQRTLGTINWTAAFGGDGAEVCFHSQNPIYILGETQRNGVRRSINGGASWSQATSGLTGTGAWVAPIMSHPDTSGIFYTARQRVFKTTNWGASWFGISSGTTGTIREMAVSKSDALVMYATASSRVYKSTNGGSSYTQITNGLPARTVTSINVHPDSSNVAIVTYSGFGTNKIYKTTNGGTTWDNLSGNLPDAPVNDGMIYYPGSSTSTYIVATDVGVFISNNWGASWVELAPGLPNTVAMHLDYHAATNKLRIGTHGRGVFETEVTTGISNVSSEIPSEFMLSQNYPNPFNPATTIRFSVVNNEQVKLTVFNMVGKEVGILVDSKLQPGTYEVNYNMDRMTSGVYFYRIQTSSFTDTKKMILLK